MQNSTDGLGTPGRRSLPGAVYLAPLTLLLALGAWFWTPGTETHAPTQASSYAQGESPQPAPPDQDCGERHHRGRHHGPPRPPVALIFLMGGAFGYLIGRKGPHHGPYRHYPHPPHHYHGCHCPPPHSPRSEAS